MRYLGAPARFDWETPAALFAALNAEFRFTIDVCATELNTKCQRYIDPAQDGLSQPWEGATCWMNPPYGSAIRHWMRKAFTESQRGATVVCLVPARTDTAWWHDYAMRGEIRYLRGRVKFLTDGQPITHASRKGASSAPFPCAVVVFRPGTPGIPMRRASA